MLTLNPAGGAPPRLADLEAQAAAFTAAALADNTIRAYAADWRDFQAWCEAHCRAALPADEETVVLYLTDLAARAKAATITRRVVAIRHAHSAGGHESPVDGSRVRVLLRGIRHSLGTKQRQKAPLLTDDVRRMVATCRQDNAGVRDHAILLLGFAGGLRRSEIADLRPDDVEMDPRGMVVTIRRSKTDQEGAGREIGIPFGEDPATCPVRAVEAWLAVRGGTSAANDATLFGVNDRTIAEIVKRRAAAAGVRGDVGGHSMRAGHVTQAAINGVDERAIMNQTGQRSVRTVRRYIRHATLFVENSAGGLGL